MPAIYHEGSWLGNATDPEVLAKDTVGWTGKNRAYSQTNNAVIAHIENGITYDVSWTGSATVTLKKNSASGATITSGSTSPLSFTADADYELYFGSSATVTNIMVKDSRITDPTYEPYHESVEEEIEQIYADNGVLGAKNLLENNAKSQTVNGVTFTVNADGSVTANGTATTNIVTINIPISLPIGKYTFSGTNGQSGGSDSKYYARLRKVGGIQFTSSEVSPLPVESINGSEKTFSVLQDGLDIIYQICIYSAAGAISNLTFYPMIRLASDPDDTYQPYAMTNRELTEKVFEKRILSSGDDLNNITETGIYHVATSVSNVPENRANLTLIVNGFDRTQIRQVLMTREAMYTRSKEGATWKPWYKYTGTEVS